jgi:hypothetical protein
MGFNPFATVSDYPGMLNKISTCTFFVALLLVWLVRVRVPAIDNVLVPLALPIPVVGVNFQLGTVFPAFLIAFLSRIVKLHDRISDVLRIRYRFDVEAILLPLAIGSSATLKADVVRKIRQQRQPLMYKTFYEYASSTPKKAKIDAHYIIMALDQWSWYWILVEAAFLVLITSVILLFAKHYLPSALLLLCVLGITALLQYMRHHCENYAQQQVEAILSDQARRAEVAEVFRAL